MALGDKGYGQNSPVGFDTATTRDDQGKATAYLEPDTMAAKTHYLEVVSLDVFERDGKDFLKVILFDPRNGLITEEFGEIKPKTMWKLERAIRGIFGRVLPLAKVQGPTGRMPLETRTNALGVFVEVEIKDSDYEGQDVLIVGSQGYAAPDGVSPMFDSSTHEPTGAWPTDGAGLLAKRGGGGKTSPAAGASSGGAQDDDEDW